MRLAALLEPVRPHWKLDIRTVGLAIDGDAGDHNTPVIFRVGMERADEPCRHLDERAVLSMRKIAKRDCRIEFAVDAVGNSGAAVFKLRDRSANRRRPKTGRSQRRTPISKWSIGWPRRATVNGS
jgi:hypothetical protein